MAEAKANPPPLLPVSEPPIHHVMVVGFHHQKGSTIEYMYPPLQASTDSLTSALPSQWRSLPHIALPDGCHNYHEGNVLFTLESLTKPGECVYGVSTYRQIDSKEVVNKDVDVTRSTIQKAVCVLSRWPVFSFLRAKVKLATHAYFNSKNFNETSILIELFDDLNYTLTPDHALSVCLQGYQLVQTVTQLGHKLLQLYKAMLIKRRIMIYGSNPDLVSTIVMGLVSLMPLYLQSLIKPKTTNDYGLPLALYPSQVAMRPYVPVQQMDLFNNDAKPVIVGTVNPLFVKQHDKLVDIMYNTDSKQLVLNDTSLRTTLNLSSPDLRFSESLKSVTSATRGDSTSQQEGDTSEQCLQHPVSWEGGEDWIRGQFQVYLLGLLSTTVEGDSVAFDDYNSDFVQVFMKTDIYSKWMLTPHLGIQSVPAKHVFEGELSLSDIKRQLTVRAEEFGLNKVMTPTQVEQVGQVISATKDTIQGTMGRIWNTASNTFVSWWGNTAAGSIDSDDDDDDDDGLEQQDKDRPT